MFCISHRVRVWVNVLKEEFHQSIRVPPPPPFMMQRPQEEKKHREKPKSHVSSFPQAATAGLVPEIGIPICAGGPSSRHRIGPEFSP